VHFVFLFRDGKSMHVVNGAKISVGWPKNKFSIVTVCMMGASMEI